MRYPKTEQGDLKTWTKLVTSSEEKQTRKETFNVTGESKYAGSKSAVRRIPNFEAVRDKFCVVKWGKRTKRAQVQISFRDYQGLREQPRATEQKAIV